MAELAANTELRIELSTEEMLGAPAEWAVAAADQDGPITGSADIRIERDGAINGVAGMFIAELARGVELTNCPDRAGFFRRWQNLYPLVEPVAVRAGDRVSVTMDIRPANYLISWRLAIHRDAGSSPVTSRGSTALGAFVTPADLRRARLDAVPRRSGGLVADKFILDLADDHRTLVQIGDLAWDVHGPAYASRQALQARVEQLLRRHVSS